MIKNHQSNFIEIFFRFEKSSKVGNASKSEKSEQSEKSEISFRVFLYSELFSPWLGGYY